MQQIQRQQTEASTTMTRAFLNLFHCSADNVGDQMCGPCQYLWPDLFENSNLNRSLPESTEVVVLGGGQIFSQLSTISASISHKNRSVKLIAWGVGIPPKGKRDADIAGILSRFSAFSTRNYEWREALDFIPCASCLSPAFDNPQSPTNEVVVYMHRRKPGPASIPTDIPTMSNSMRDPISVINFIASGETVVTSSYHGVYWAQLLGRKVVCIPYNNKFRTFQYEPTYAEPESWMQNIRSAKRFDPLLAEYRRLNRGFASRVEDLWDE
ncbi:polysaccharide pyruvyl transferase family protein [Tabrizicola thermarum]|uniref:polysaccharide pyruvyl transferase family protein n=1 Tax=Tabrizicola thermarum TaxID=2670345 RepID=UPI000FFB0F12|nr:polysaccharide pyruvyl transferase family protein [Tabrizicola thermarum]